MKITPEMSTLVESEIIFWRLETCTIVSQLDKCLKFKSVRGEKSDCSLYKIAPRNVINFRHLSSCGTIIFWIYSGLNRVRLIGTSLQESLFISMFKCILHTFPISRYFPVLNKYEIFFQVDINIADTKTPKTMLN